MDGVAETKRQVRAKIDAEEIRRPASRGELQTIAENHQKAIAQAISDSAAKDREANTAALKTIVQEMRSTRIAVLGGLAAIGLLIAISLFT